MIDPSDLQIRPYRESDRDALIALWDDCRLTRAWNDPDADLALMQQSEANAAVFVGEHEGRLVASCFVGHDGHRGWLYYLASDPRLQRSGLGGRMVRHCEAWLDARGVAKCQVMIREENLVAKRFYQRIGYEPNRCHLMQRWLRERGAPKVVPDARDDGRLSCTITYLEMTERPKLPPVHLTHDTTIALLRAQQPTVAFYRFLYDRVGEPWLWWERRAMDDEELGAIIGDERVEIYVLYANGTPAGFAELDCRALPVVDLAYFGLMPEFIGRGLGGHLLAAAIENAWRHEPEKLTVNTNTLDHPKALPLYQRLGFRPVKQEMREIDDPRLTGLI